jgi:hypothetical protein
MIDDPREVLRDKVLEEAARTRPKPVDEEAHHLKAADYTAGWNAAVRAYAAAIRGLKGKTDD